MATTTSASRGLLLRPGSRTDGELARAAGRGDVEAFEELYVRHHLALLSFSRHMLGQAQDGEDVVQHTFLAADTAFRQGRIPRSVRAWLYTVARNRCVSVIRARRSDPGLPDHGVPSTEDLAADVERREELRNLLADLRTLPDDQRAALLLAQLGELSHAEVAQVIGVRTNKVKALVLQARQALMATADARMIPCRSIQEELAVASGSALRRRHLRDHVAHCDACRIYAERVAVQRASLTAILPVIPTVALRDSVLAGLGAGGATAAGAGAGLGLLAAKSTVAKVLAVAAVGGAAAGGATVAVSTLDPQRAGRPARASGPPPAPAAPVAAPATPAAGTTPGTSRSEPGRRTSAPARLRADRTRGQRGKRGRAAEPGDRPATSPATAAPAPPPAAAGGSARPAPDAPRGRALGRANQPAPANGRAHAPPRPAAKPPHTPPRAAPKAAERARGKPAAPGSSGTAEPQPAEPAHDAERARRPAAQPHGPP